MGPAWNVGWLAWHTSKSFFKVQTLPVCQLHLAWACTADYEAPMIEHSFWTSAHRTICDCLWHSQLTVAPCLVDPDSSEPALDSINQQFA